MDIQSLTPDPGRLKCVWIPGADGRLQSIWVADRQQDAEVVDLRRQRVADRPRLAKISRVAGLRFNV